MNYFELYREIWNFHKKFSEVKNTDEYWQAVIDESNEILKKYDKHKFANDLLLAVISELERIYKEMRANADTRV
ncbi:hypothetical protein [Mediterraneibacter glycyrrhizinilyticus]|uniref:hypothetical protein n=1 Tax=Mediterraneibacter glycyrrhizinilyticus TaxID=342942 RepID=UPI0006D04528